MPRVWKCFWPGIGCLLFLPASVFAYNRGGALDYVNAWYNTNAENNPQRNANHINNSGDTFNVPLATGSLSSLSGLPQDALCSMTAVDCANNQSPSEPLPLHRPQSPIVDLPLNNDSQDQSLGNGPRYHEPGDPNEMFGPAGQVEPGETLSYAIQFENEGDGTAYGVYATDVLDPSLDDSTLSIGNFNALNFVSGSTVPASYPYKYDPATCTRKEKA